MVVSLSSFTARSARARACTLSLALLAFGCGSDADNSQALPDENEGGASATPNYPPAIGPEDCATTTSEITLTQPAGAAVWGGLVRLEFEVEGAKVDAFDIQAFDPSIEAWSTFYLGSQAIAQRDDGSYLVAVSPYFSEANKDKELKLRIRPSQQGCPEADWTETAAFTAGDPLVGTKWLAQIPATSFSGQLGLVRTPLTEGPALPTARVSLGDVTLAVDFGKKGQLTQVLTLPFSTKPDLPYDGCSLSLTFAGTYEVSVRQQYGGLTLGVSEQTLTSFEGTTCDFPTVQQMALSAADFDVRLNAYSQQGISINYLPTLYVEPEAPVWQNSNLAQVFQQLVEFLNYETASEMGGVTGYINPQDLTLEQQ